MNTWQDLTTDTLGSFGSKATNLNRLHRAGMTIAPGIVLDSSYEPNEAELVDVLEGLKFPLIVRSSTTLEDTASSSMAGVFKSVTVHGTSEVLSAVQTVKEWSHSKAVGQLLHDLQLSPDDLKTHVIIQEYITAMRGGVLFTNPIARQFEVQIGASSVEVTDGLSRAESQSMSLDEKLNSSDRAMITLQNLATDICKEFSEPQDVEWLIDDKGVLYVLQARPQVVTNDEDVGAVTTEINRLKEQLHPHGQYSSEVLPDLGTPTPVTIDLLASIYSSHGPYGRYLASKGYRLPAINTKYVVSIFARPYFDVQACNQTLFSNLSKKLVLQDGVLWQKTHLRGVVQALLHPIVNAQVFIDQSRLFFRLGTVIEKPVPDVLSQEASLEEIIQYIHEELSPNIFETSDFLQLVESSLKKYVKNAQDLERSTEDTSHTTWAQEDAWSLSEDENEISSDSLSDTKDAEDRLQELRNHTYDNSKKLDVREAIYKKIMSAWDRTATENLLASLDILQRRRSDLHSRHVRSIRLIHIRLKAIDAEQNLHDTIWYAGLSEILDSKQLDRKALSKRKQDWELLQNQECLPVNGIRAWSDILRVDEFASSRSNQFLVLSKGSFSGVGSREIHNGGVVLITKSLSQSIIFNHRLLAGVVTERGGRLSHVAILARELGLPIVQVDSVYGLEGRRLELNKSGNEFVFTAKD